MRHSLVATFSLEDGGTGRSLGQTFNLDSMSPQEFIDDTSYTRWILDRKISVYGNKNIKIGMVSYDPRKDRPRDTVGLSGRILATGVES